MAALTLELTTTPGTITGDVNYYENLSGGDYTAIVTNPNPAVIHDDQSWHVDLENFTQSGAIFGAFGGNFWHFKVLFEQLGAGEGPASKTITFPVNTSSPFTYPTKTVTFSPGEIPEGEYKVYVTIKMLDSNGLSPIAGAGELTQSGALLQVINA